MYRTPKVIRKAQECGMTSKPMTWFFSIAAAEGGLVQDLLKAHLASDQTRYTHACSACITLQ